MSHAESISSNKKFYNVIDGIFRTLVPESHPEAVAREWKTNDGKTGTKYEKHIRFLAGTVEDIAFRDGDYGRQIMVFLDKDEDGNTPVIQLSANGQGSYYGDDLLKKLPNLKSGTEYRFMPYDFTDDDNKRRVGVQIVPKNAEGTFEKENAIKDFFFDGTNNLHDFPTATDEDKSDWPFYFKKVNKFLVKYSEENVLPKFAENKSEEVQYPEEEINAEDIPF